MKKLGLLTNRYHIICICIHVCISMHSALIVPVLKINFFLVPPDIALYRAILALANDMVAVNTPNYSTFRSLNKQLCDWIIHILLMHM